VQVTVTGNKGRSSAQNLTSSVVLANGSLAVLSSAESNTVRSCVSSAACQNRKEKRTKEGRGGKGTCKGGLEAELSVIRLWKSTVYSI